jgi:Flp pilus assembly protein TadB
LLKFGADPNLGSSERFLNIPLISATFKQNEKMIVMLISYGANVEEALDLAEKNKGFPLRQEQKDLLNSASNLEKLIRRRRY